MRRVCFGVLGLILLGGAGLLWWWSTSINSERIERTLAARVGEETGFKVSFGEAMEFEWLPVPGLVAQDITLSNPRESQDSPLARIRKIRVRLDVLGSLRHRMVKLGRLSATGVQIRLTRNAEGEANWQTGAETGTGDDVEDGDDLVSRVQALEIQDLDAHYRDAVTGEAFELSLVSFHLDRAPSGGPADLEAKGELNGESFALTGTLSPDLGKGQAGGTNTRELGNFRLDILINIGNGAATLNVSGLTGRPSDFLGTDLEISVVSPDPSAL
ncbi:MAG: AsmA family protein, partial [Myxococcota bacterium]